MTLDVKLTTNEYMTALEQLGEQAVCYYEGKSVHFNPLSRQQFTFNFAAGLARHLADLTHG